MLHKECDTKSYTNAITITYYKYHLCVFNAMWYVKEYGVEWLFEFHYVNDEVEWSICTPFFEVILQK